MSDSPRQRGRPKAFQSRQAQNTIQSLDRALEVLERLTDADGQTLTEIAQDMDQSPATIYRVLQTLEARGVVETDPAAQTWHVGPAAFRLGSAFLRRSSVVERARPVMRRLMEETGETANLGIERAEQVMFVSQVESHETIRAFFPPGTLSPMHASGIGKALLSALDEVTLARRMRGAMLQRFTDKTITDPAALMTELGRIRSQGYSYDDEEKAPGMRCIAAPVRDIHGEAVAGISVSGPSTRMTPDRIETISRAVVNAATELSRAQGAPGLLRPLD